MKKITLTLSAGILVLGPMLAATFRDNKEAIKESRSGLLPPPEMVELTCTLAHACAARVDPSITLDQIDQLIDLENFGDVFSACFGVSVPAPLELRPGEAVQAVNHST